ncbi:TniQ family protein, partial [Roseibium sp.]|uniref:TniQ family protein n=1 Tax=Roseibium sp. TaxID=1936156 RepID=UPI003A985C9A
MKLDPFYVPTCHADETITSFVSRVAAMASRDARSFCLDMRLKFQNLCDGDPTGLTKFTELVGFEDGFPGTTFERTANCRFELNGEPLPRASLCRATVRVCPHCIQEDLERNVDHEKVRPYGRWSWTIASIRTCSKHNTPLAVAATDDHPQRQHDFSLLLRPFVDDIDQQVATAKHREPSQLEIYLERRLAGDRPDIWLSSLPAYAAARACEIIGATKLHGARVMTNSLTEDQWYEAGQTGFDICIHGPDEIRAYLDQMQQTFTNTRRAWGPKQIYGRLYEWLAHETTDAAYESLRAIITGHAFNTLPMGPDDEIFGQHPVTRTLHSVHSAHIETGAHPKRLKKVLHAFGLIGEDQLGRSDERILFRANDAKFILERIEESMSLNQVRAYINVPRPFERTLFEANILKPWLYGGTETFSHHAFAKRDLDGFLEALTAKALPATGKEPNLMPILRAAKVANCTTLKVVQLILDGHLFNVRTSPEETGFLSVLVDLEEVKTHVRLEDHGG